jgi:hypothetical protein
LKKGLFPKLPKLNAKTRRPIWSIAIYSGNSPFNLNSGNIKNPVLQAKDVFDVPAEFIADPFMVKVNEQWHMYFEVLNKNTTKGCIGLASSCDGLNWEYKGVVINETFHMSYPYVFKWKNDYYMLPETCENNSIRLYKSTKMPTDWIYMGNLLEGNFFDSSIFEYNEMLWLFTGTKSNTLRLYYSYSLQGVWMEHPESPIISNNAHIARPSGRITVWNNKIYRFSQDTKPYYGKQVRTFEITKLTTTLYEEKEISIILGGTGREGDWNVDGMHHIDPHELENGQWLACVDGHKFVERNKYVCKAEFLFYQLKHKLINCFTE